MVVEVMQYLLPDGRQKPVTAEVPDEMERVYRDMQDHGCRIEAEMLTTGLVSQTIFNIEEAEDVDIELTANGPDVIPALIKMLNRKLWTYGNALSSEDREKEG